jgi:hypothetical protein
MTKIPSLGLAALLVLSVGAVEPAHSEDADFCAIFAQYFADRALGFVGERDVRSAKNQNLWIGKKSFPDTQCAIGEQYVQCKYSDPGVIGPETLSRHMKTAQKIDECVSKLPGLQKTQLKRMHDTDTHGSMFVLSEGWEVDDSGGTYTVSLIRSGLVLMYTAKP